MLQSHPFVIRTHFRNWRQLLTSLTFQILLINNKLQTHVTYTEGEGRITRLHGDILHNSNLQRRGPLKFQYMDCFAGYGNYHFTHSNNATGKIQIRIHCSQKKERKIEKIPRKMPTIRLGKIWYICFMW